MKKLLRERKEADGLFQRMDGEGILEGAVGGGCVEVGKVR